MHDTSAFQYLRCISDVVREFFARPLILLRLSVDLPTFKWKKKGRSGWLARVSFGGVARGFAARVSDTSVLLGARHFEATPPPSG